MAQTPILLQILIVYLPGEAPEEKQVLKYATLATHTSAHVSLPRNSRPYK